MTDLNTLWNEADPGAPKGNELADGIYDCTLRNVGIRESKKGNTGVAWDFTDNRSGSQIFKWSRLRAGVPKDFIIDAGWLKEDMNVLGLACGGFDEVERTLQTMIGATVRVEIETKDNGYRNIKIAGKLADPPKKMYEGMPPEEDVPF
jgi:hypothetical protein